MLSFSAVVTRNNHLYNSALSYKFRDKYSYQRFSVIVNNLTRRHIAYQNNHTRKVTLINNEGKLLRRIHTSSSLNCLSPFGENGKLSQLLTSQQPNASAKDLFEQSNSSKNNDDIEKNDYNTDRSIVVDRLNHSHEYRHEKREKYSLKDIEKMYHNPVSKLNEIYQLVNTELEKIVLNVEFHHLILEKNDNKWKCTIRVSWPTESSFSAISNNKSSARNQASLKCLHWLENLKKVHHGKPVLYTKADIIKLSKTPTRISIHPETLFEAKLIADKYEENLKSLVETSLDEIEDDMFRFQKYQDDTLADPVGRANPGARLPEKIKERNLVLQLRYESRMMTDGYADLPIKNFREKILTELSNNQVILIKGDTGCGKTTQVPQYIMDEFAMNNAATDCNIIVTQPRRISAISLAERVAEERQEQVGDVVGYQVRLDQVLPSTPGGILYCTSGILLRKLIFNPTLKNCSHLIIDEAHERTINIDMILGLVKRAMKKNPALKVIVMSATLNAELFENYYNCKVIEVPGNVYPVEMNFLSQIDRLGLRAPSQYDLTFQDVLQTKDVPIPDICKMGELISWIVKNKPPGGILCFLPGWSEITFLKKYLEEFALLPHNEIAIFVIHSRISPYEQRKIFLKLPENKRKIVLATDIAETGITVSDIVYVIDSCIHKQKKWIEDRGVLTINNTWVSKANIQQRKGRAGRVKPGVSYHMISSEHYDQLEPFPLPEIKRTSLEKTVLDIKTYSDEKIMDFIQSMPEPPSAFAVKRAIEDLIKIGAVDNNENLTALGKRIAFFSSDPKISKAMVYSTIFQCVSPMLTIAAIASSDHDLFTKALFNKEAIRRVKKKYHPSSDQVAMAWLLKEWNKYFVKSKDTTRDFCRKNNLYHERMYTIHRVRELQADYLTIVRMLPYKDMFDDMDASVNEYSQLDELVKGVLLSGLNNVLYRRNFDFRKGILKKGTSVFVMNDNSHAIIAPESVNFKRKNFPSPYLLFDHRTHFSERRTTLVRNSSIISPLTSFLFCQNRILGRLQSDGDDDDNNNNNKKSVIFTVEDNKNMNFICDKETADVLVNFREAMWGVVRYMVTTFGLTHREKTEVFEQVNAYRTEMLQVLAKMLNEAAVNIDRPEDDNKREDDN
ncbi:ATP-dependent RNA helicase DHX30-like [Chelonus insularis]|uniref:ATP-dependent RNA helicase DHX30-like n=1 Tax=Chelonus insularis TaxID=460826 RepID=UPI001589FD22|nr:ATP-dependent RNA helicase DHX30-like [Chelonus insularis]